MRADRLIAKLKRLYRNENGNIALIFGLTAVPLVSIAGLAIDKGRITEASSTLQQITDGAALAAASAKGSDTQREATGTAYLNRNVPELFGVTAKPVFDATGNSVSVKIDAVVQCTLLAVALSSSESAVAADAGAETGPVLPTVGFGIGSNAVATPAESGARCRIALNTFMDDAI